MKNPDVFIISNSMVEFPSGSDVRLVKIVKRTGKFFSTGGIISAEAKKYFVSEGISIKNCRKTIGFIKIFNYYTGAIITYFVRALQSIYYLPKFKNNLIFYSPTNIMVDVLPCVLGKAINRNSKLICVIHHLLPQLQARGISMQNVISSVADKITNLLVKYAADSIIVINSQVKKGLIVKGLKNRIFIIGNGIETTEIDKYRKTIKKKYDGIFFGRLNSSKGVLELPEIWKNVVEKKPDSKLLIIGNGEKEVVDDIKTKIATYGLKKNIFILGYLPRKELIEYIFSSKVLVFPSREEGFGIAIAEALYCGLPVAAYNLEVYDEFYPGCILKSEFGNYKSFSDTILDLLTNQQKYDRLSQRAVSIAENFSWDKVSKIEKEVIKRLFAYD